MTAAVRQMLSELSDLELDALDGVFCQMRPFPAGSRVDLDALVARIRALPAQRLRELAKHSASVSGSGASGSLLKNDGDDDQGRMFELVLLGLTGVEAGVQYRAEQERVQELIADGLSGAEAWSQIRREYRRSRSTERIRGSRRRR